VHTGRGAAWGAYVPFRVIPAQAGIQSARAVHTGRGAAWGAYVPFRVIPAKAGSWIHI